MESTVWQPTHCEALKELFSKGMSYAEATQAINAKFGTAYSRSAVLGRARRMRLGGPERSTPEPGAESALQREAALRTDDFLLLKLLRRSPSISRVEAAQLRCVEVIPRHMDLIELERSGCRYPYGGDKEGETITFCGHPQRKGSSYCTPHFFLTRNPDAPVGRTASRAPLRLVATGGRFQVREVRNGTTEAPQGIRSLTCI